MKASFSISGALLVVVVVLVIVWLELGPASVPVILAFTLAVITFGQFVYSAWPSLYAEMVTEFPSGQEAGGYLSLLESQGDEPTLLRDRPVPYYRLRDVSRPLVDGKEVRKIPALKPGSEENIRGYLPRAKGEREYVIGERAIVAPAYLDLHIVNAGPGVATKIECVVQNRDGGGYVVLLSYYAILGRFFGRKGRFEFEPEGEWTGPF
ncbi:MAG: hypothetical protein JRN06_06590 [Nitrososphaerota archaeon]|nr:hypothetical protein [Nitrososphaerota archaeon]